MITKSELDKYLSAYNEGHPLISDSEYDSLLEEYLNKNGEDNRPYLRQTQSKSINAVVGTLTKVYGVNKPMRDGQKIYGDWIKQKHINPDLHVYVQPKFDGCSVAYDCNTHKFFTRGKYDDGVSIDVTELFSNSKIYVENYQSYDSIKFEAIISPQIFLSDDRHLNLTYKRPRDVVSATITSRDISKADLITLVPLRVYRDGKSYLPPILKNISMDTTADDKDGIETFISNLLCNQAIATVNDMGFECDGTVVSVYDNDGVIHDEVAIKILNNSQESTLIDVQYQFGNSGRITPVAIIKPIKFGEVTVRCITLSTIDRVDNMHLKYNDTVRVIYNIVPYLLSSNHDGTIPIPLPSHCPICGCKLDMSSLSLIKCTNPNCQGLKIGSIIRYCEKMNMYGVAEKTIVKLYAEKIISNISDLYKITVNDIMTLDGFKETSANNIIKSINKASHNVDIYSWLGSLPFDDIGKRTWKTIIMAMDNNILNAFINSLSNDTADDTHKILDMIQIQRIIGIGTIIANKIINGLYKNWNDISDICHNKYVTFNAIKNQQVKGVITLTGTRDRSVTQYLIDKGYDVNSSFTNKTTILVVPSSSFTSSKVVRAKQLNIPIFTINEVYTNIK